MQSIGIFFSIPWPRLHASFGFSTGYLSLTLFLTPARIPDSSPLYLFSSRRTSRTWWRQTAVSAALSLWGVLDINLFVHLKVMRLPTESFMMHFKSQCVKYRPVPFCGFWPVWTSLCSWLWGCGQFSSSLVWAPCSWPSVELVDTLDYNKWSKWVRPVGGTLAPTNSVFFFFNIFKICLPKRGRTSGVVRVDNSA